MSTERQERFGAVHTINGERFVRAIDFEQEREIHAQAEREWADKADRILSLLESDGVVEAVARWEIEWLIDKLGSDMTWEEYPHQKAAIQRASEALQAAKQAIQKELD